MGSLTNEAEVLLMDHTFNKDTYTNGTVYLGLSDADPTEAATGASCNEMDNLYNYARVAITFAAATGRSITQSGAVNFAQISGGDLGTATHYCIFDSGTYGAGNCLAYGALDTSKDLNDGNTPSVADGECVITVAAGEVSNYLANAWLDFMFRNQTFTSPTTYCGFTTTTIVDGDAGADLDEPTGGGYARLLVYENGGGTPDWEQAVSGAPTVVDNDDELAWSAATSPGWGTVVAFFVADSGTTGAGNVLMYDNGIADQEVAEGDTAKVAANACDWTLD